MLKDRSNNKNIWRKEDRKINNNNNNSVPPNHATTSSVVFPASVIWRKNNDDDDDDEGDYNNDIEQYMTVEELENIARETALRNPLLLVFLGNLAAVKVLILYMSK